MVSPEDYEQMPLKQRLKFLLANRCSSEIRIPLVASEAVVEEKGHRGCHSMSACFPEEKIIEIMAKEEHTGEAIECVSQYDLAQKHNNPSQTIAAATMSERIGSAASSSVTSVSAAFFPKQPVTVKVEQAGHCVENLSTGHRSVSSVVYQAFNFDSQTSAEPLDELDQVVLRERLRRLLTRKPLGLMSKMLKDHHSVISLSTSTSHLKTAGAEKELKSDNEKLSVCGNQKHENVRTLESGSSSCCLDPSCKTSRALGYFSGGGRSFSATDEEEFQRNGRMYSSNKNISKYDSKVRKGLLSDEITVQQTTIPNLTNVKVEPQNYCEFQSCTTVDQISSPNKFPLKTEVEIPCDSYEDKLDHMLLRERMKLLSSKDDSKNNAPQSSERMSQVVKSALGCRPVASRPAQTLKVNRSRKRRKTATDSVETAMEEDAPGLLQVLIEKGVSVDEIKLYGEPESNDALDDSPTEASFAELEEVITKLFFQRESFFKFGPIGCSKVEKASYCLQCLFSLVEQARYLQFRNWPVEWGWCRELQSFIFLFERHNRIVLERPEYGYATYFFELVDSLPIDWQIKRLVTAMKLTSCGRVTLLENRALKVGDDLSEGEAKVLMAYGWTPDTGLGTMLNYCDRVFHDRKNEEDTSEWRSKIGKLLMDGFNGGTIISVGIPEKAMEYNIAHPVEIKLEHS